MEGDGRDTTLRFDRAAYESGGAPAAPSCGFCKQSIASVYFQVGDEVACHRCRAAIVQKREAGSGFLRFLRASLYGSLAGAVGAAIWYGVRALTGYEVGLIALVVGLLVGGAVRAGSAGRGGWRYQALAMALTYVSIVSTYVPMVVTALYEGATHAETTAETTAAPVVTSDSTPSSTPASALQAGESRPKTPSAGRLALALGLFAAVVVVFALAVPFLGGLENVIGLVIIAIGLYEAWQMNRRVPLVITGPHRVGKGLTAPAGD